MQALDLNLASRPFRNNTLIWLALLVSVGLLVGFSVWNLNAFRANETQLASLREQVGGVEGRLAELETREERANAAAAGYDLKKLFRQSSKANDVIEWKAFSWTRLFNLLEQVQPYDVKMLSIRPVFYASERRSVQDGAPEDAVPVRVEAVAKNLKTFLEFERSLLADPHFDRVEPEGNTLLDSGEVGFQLRFMYFPRMPENREEIDLPPLVELATPKAFAEAEAAYKASLENGGESENGDAKEADGETPPNPDETAPEVEGAG